MKIDQDYSAEPPEDSGRTPATGSPTGSPDSDSADQGYRYLGGSGSAAPYRARLPQWFRAFLLLLALGITALTLLAVVSWKFESGEDQPRFRLITADRSAMYPVLSAQFVTQDRERLTGTLGSDGEQDVREVSDRVELKQAISEALLSGGGPTRVLYLQLPVASVQGQGFLLAQNSDPQSPASGLTVGQLVETLGQVSASATTTCENILLILDICSTSHNLRTGTLASQFVEDFEAALTEYERTHNVPNMVVLCSSGFDETRTVSATLNGSPFALCVRYALDGGTLADVRGLRRSPPDDVVSAAEVADFVQAAVADWTLKNRGHAQIPLTFQFGTDFSIHDVNPELTFAALLEPPSAASDTAETEAIEADTAETDTAQQDPVQDGAAQNDAEKTEVTDADGADDASAGASTGTAANNASASGMPDGVHQLSALRARLDRLTRTSVFPRRSIHFAFLSYTLQRAEIALLGGRPERFAGLISDVSEMCDKLESLEAADGENAVPGADATRTRELVDAALAKPSTANLAKLLSLTTSDARGVLILASGARAGETWRDPQLVADAVELRRLSERVSRGVSPLIVEFVRDELEAANQRRVRSEIAVLSGRSDEAVILAADARSAYQAIAQTGEELEQRLILLQRTLLAMPAVLDWLCTLEHLGEPAVNEAAQLMPFLEKVLAFCEDPSQPRLRSAAAAADGMRRSLNQAALDALVQRDWPNMAACLHVPLLDSELRQRLVRSLLTFKDSTRFAAISQTTPPPPTDELPCLEQLQAYVEYVNSLQSACREALDDRMLGGRQIGPLLESLQVAISGRMSDGESTTVGGVQAAFQRWVLDVQRYPLRVRPQLGPVTQAQWHTRCLSLSLAYWTGSVSQTLALQDAVLQNLWEQAASAREEWLEAETRRLERRLPHQWTASADANASRNPGQGPNPVFEVAGRSALTIPAGTSSAVPLVLRALQTFDQDTPVELVWEWSQREYPLSIAINGRAAQNGRLRVPLATPVALSEQVLSLSIMPTADTTAGAASAAAGAAAAGAAPVTGDVPLGVRVEAGDRNYWLPIRLEIVEPATPAARLALKWDDAILPNGRIDLLPNESIPITFDVVVERPLPEPLRVEFLGAGEPQSVALADIHGKPGTHPVPPPEGFQVPFQGDGVTVELLSGSRRLDRVELRAAILDLSQCFRPEVRFNPATQRLSATVTRLQRSDVDSAVSLELSAGGAEAASVGGQPAAVLEPPREQAAADLRFPAGWSGITDAELSVSGVPRAFRFAFPRDELQGQLDDELRVQFIDPQPFARWEFRKGYRELPVRLQADGGESLELSVGIDLDNNGRLDDYEVQLSQPCWYGRQKSLSLEPSADGAAWHVRSTVGDVDVSVDVSGLLGRQTIAVRVAGAGQRRTARLPIFLLQEAPPVEILWPRTDEPQSANLPLSVTLQTDRQLIEAVDSVQVGFDANGDGALADEELIVPLGALPGGTLNFADSARLNLRLPLPEDAGEAVRLLARTRSRVQPEPAPDAGEGAAGPEAGTANGDAGAGAAGADGEDSALELVGEPARAQYSLTTQGRIRGVVTTSDGAPQSNVRIALGRVNLTLTDDDGRFELPPVPAGVYTVAARKGNRSAVSLVAVKAAQATDVKLTLYVK